MTMKIFQKGQVVIPAILRNKYQIDIGDQIDILPMPDGILLKPRPKTHIQKTLTQSLFGIFNTYSNRKQELSKTDIEQATETGFTEGWNE